MSWHSLAAWRARQSGRVVFTNGVFDLLHPGHVRYLQQARTLGDVLIVAINADRSVRANKGPARPITPEQERAEILGALECVDAVTIFDEETPFEIIRALQPDVLVKGADWAHDASGRVPVKQVVRVGSAGAQILHVLDEEIYDLVVAGSHGRTGIKRALLGSVAEKLVRHAGCPVLVAR